MAKATVYTVGGAVQAGGGLYITRQADQDLLKLCREGAFAYVLTSRQVGKSSLMVRAAEQLAEEGIRSVIVDLTVFGVQITAEAWYLGLLTAISDRLNLSTDVVEWWRSQVQFGGTQRLTEFFKGVLLAEIKEQVVIFIDEIDSTLSLPAINGQPFTDDFYAAIRYLYNARATEPDFRRLSFVLIGVATPSDLIHDLKRTPFNIGSRVDITDFTFDEALPLADGLGMPNDQARNVLRWVIKWTGGHPYLTQRLCRVVAEQYRSSWSEEEVDCTVANTFFGRMSEHDNNLQFVRDMLTRRAPDKLAVLSTYKDIRLGRLLVRDEEQSPIKSHLKLSGVVKRENGKLQVRNPIYREVFDRDWIQEYWPVSWWQTVPLYAKIGSGVIVLLSIASFILTLYAFNLAKQNERIANENKRIAQSERQTRDSIQVVLNEQQSLKLLADSASAEALESAKSASDEAMKATRSAERERLARLEEAKQRQRAEEETKRANRREIEADSSRREAVKNLTEVERRRRIDIARTLAIQAPLQQANNAELAILLARQAFLLNTRYLGPWNRQIYEALLKTLNGAGGPQAFRGHTATVRNVAFNATGEIIASASDDKTVLLWNRQQNFANAISLNGHTQSVRALAFSPDGQTLASASDDQTVRLWNVRAPRAGARILTGHRGGVWALAFNADGKTLASGSADSTVRLWNVEKNNAGAVLTRKHKSRVRAVILTPNGQWLGAAGDDGTIQLWPVADNNPQNVVEVKHGNGVKSLAFKPELGLLVSGGADGKVMLWKWNATGEPPKVQKEFLAHDAAVNAVAFSLDGKRLATASADKRVKIWELNQTNEPALVFDHANFVWSVAFSPDGNTLASGSADNLVQLWTTRTEILAEKACQVVKRNLSEEEWHAFIGADIEYEKSCDSLQGGKTNSTKGTKDENK